MKSASGQIGCLTWKASSGGQVIKARLVPLIFQQANTLQDQGHFPFAFIFYAFFVITYYW